LLLLLSPSDVVRRAQSLALALCRRSDDQADNEAVQTQGLGEDEDEDHADEEPWLLGVGPNASIAHDANGQSCRQGAHAHCQSCAQMRVPRVGRVGGSVHLAVDDHRGDEPVEGKSRQ